MRRTLIFILVLALVTTLGGALVQAQDDNALVAGVSDEFAGTELRLIFANHPWNNAIQQLLPQFEAASGITLRVESYFEDQLSQRLQIGLTSGTTQADAFMFRPLQEGKLFASNGWVEDLSEYVTRDAEWNWEDFQTATRSTVTFDDFLYGIPIVTEREMLYYRADIFEENGLEPPATLEELEAIAAQLNNPDEEFYGVVIRGRRSPAVTQFSSFLYSFGGDWIVDGQSGLDSPEALEAYTYYGNLLRNYGPPGTVNMSWPEALAIFQQGKAAMWIDADVFYANVIDSTQSVVADSVGFAPFPEGPAGANQYNVTSWALGMNAGSPNKDAAWEFIKWATSAPVVLELQQRGTPGARQSVWDSPEGLSGFPADYAEVVQLQSARGVGYDRPTVIRVGEARDIVGAPIVTAIEGGDVEAAVREAHEAFNAFLETDG
ncbi:MAG: sugar ABC transporter substrate-binding protein [Chloroflexota bacterium]|nr:MAG: ABC transporter substrate-binding protein [Chloroflexota bacterium]